MKNKISFFASLAILATLTVSSYQVNAAEYISGPYLRVDGGYGYGKEKVTSSINNSVVLNKTGRGGIASIGAGTSLNRYFRTELQFYFDQGFKASNNSTAITKAREKTSAAFVNAALDFPNTTSITPYIMGGAGLARNRFSLLDSNSQLRSPSKNSFAWQAGAGLSFQLSKNLQLDASYRYVHKNNNKYIARHSLPQITDFHRAKINGNNTVMLGLKVYLYPTLCNCKNNI